MDYRHPPAKNLVAQKDKATEPQAPLYTAYVQPSLEKEKGFRCLPLVCHVLVLLHFTENVHLAGLSFRFDGRGLCKTSTWSAQPLISSFSEL